MKKILALLLAAVLCFSVAACGNGGQADNSGSGQGTEQNATNEFKRETTEDGEVVISKKEFASYITQVKLTAENWKDYFHIAEITTEERTAFGEVESTETSTECTVKNVMACYIGDAAIDLTITETGESVYCEGVFHRMNTPNDYSFSWEGYTIDDFTCNKVEGELILVEKFPEDCLSTHEDGGQYLCVGTADDYMVMNIGDLKDMSMNISLAYAFYK